MTKTEWKKQYHEYRKGMFNFQERMESNNYPCGHDDMLYENQAHATEVWLQNKPVLRQVLSTIDQTDLLEWRSSDLSWYEPKMRAKYLLTSYKRSA